MKKIKLRKRRSRTFEVYPAEEMFYTWLEENIHRFKHKPVLQKKENGQASYRFEGIIENVTLGIIFESLEASFYFYNKRELCEDESDMFFDMLYINYIGWEKYHPLKGYYDADRGDHKYDYFPTQKELYINEVFEQIIVDTNELFIPTNSLYLVDYDRMTTGEITSKDTEDQPEPLFERMYPKESKQIEGLSIYKASVGGYVMYEYDLFCV